MRISISAKLTIFTLAAVTLAGSGLVAEARAAQPETGSAVVRYGDLDLKTGAGVAAFERRVAKAADRVCGPVDSRSLADHDLFAACRAKAIADASPKVDSVVAMAQAADRYAMNADAGLTMRSR